MATAASLQGHFDEISSQAAVLPLAAAPRGFAQLDISSLADGPEAASKVSSTLSKAAAGLQECQMCGCSRSAGQLSFLVTTQLNFAARSVKAAAGQFACELCRVLSSPALLLELSMPVLQSEDLTRADQLRELYMHFAAVNAAPAAITRNPEALSLWVQELATRAYSMHIVASSLKGWQLHSPSGQLVQPGAAGAALQLLQELLHKQDPSSSKAGKVSAGKRQQQQQQQQQLEASAAKPAKRKSLEVDPAAAAAGSSKKKVKKQQATPAAATPAGKHAVVQQGELAPKQAKTPQQQKQQQQQQPSATPKQQQQQQPERTPKVQKQSERTPKAKTPAQSAAAATVHKQQQQAGGSSSSSKKTKPSSKLQASRTAGGKAAAAVPFKTPQAAKSKKAKRRLSAE
uniref:Uncharacterized protein n=1 Tax=Tetradesmus obliquus TaxID=3088 RepID=A0A383VA00_TETOB|eukprot:jgi/Sobl393_1/13761/SZX61760.1